VKIKSCLFKIGITDSSSSYSCDSPFAKLKSYSLIIRKF